ncbi:hypothetical protein TNIN_207891 [Trichonephila inaurata madagascariensis]|uniref:Uncharacterized protein n=1 Tax=Trichonephila inaurata madagascariensis TaxID=2747483 RepID=A0A8X6IJH9_9ARAC|nr:hypothetical protein TNIN_207891 [Trichonephila inaurata madagascariensis]
MARIMDPAEDVFILGMANPRYKWDFSPAGASPRSEVRNAISPKNLRSFGDLVPPTHCAILEQSFIAVPCPLKCPLLSPKHVFLLKSCYLFLRALGGCNRDTLSLVCEIRGYFVVMARIHLLSEKNK